MTGIVNGARRAPSCAPALNRLVANALSLFGKYSAVTFMAQGKFPDSPMARIERAPRNSQMLTVDTLHTTVPAFSAIFIASRAPSKLSVHVPVDIPAVKIPQNVCRQAPADHIPMAHR